jgi:hypothetical protein
VTPNLGRRYFGQGLVFENSIKNSACGETNVVETFEQQLRISAMQLDVILRGRSGFEADGLANHKGNRLSFRFADGL